MTAALTAAVLGLDVLLVEKTELSAARRPLGRIVLGPNTRHSPPGEDNPENACAICASRRQSAG